MIDIQLEGERAVIDVRPNIARGEHPKGEIFKYVKEAPKGTIVEIHLPFRAEPLIAGLQSFGLNVSVNELAPNHYRVMTVKLNDI